MAPRAASCLGATSANSHAGNAIAAVRLDTCGAILLAMEYSNAFYASMAILQILAGLVSVSISSLIMMILAISILAHQLAKMSVNIPIIKTSMHATSPATASAWSITLALTSTCLIQLRIVHVTLKSLCRVYARNLTVSSFLQAATLIPMPSTLKAILLPSQPVGRRSQWGTGKVPYCNMEKSMACVTVSSNGSTMVYAWSQSMMPQDARHWSSSIPRMPASRKC